MLVLVTCEQVFKSKTGESIGTIELMCERNRGRKWRGGCGVGRKRERERYRKMDGSRGTERSRELERGRERVGVCERETHTHTFKDKTIT